jgi:O-acetylserine/cysteine efflux transporter
MRAHHLAAAVLVAALWGFNFVAIDVGLDSLPPLLFVALRFALAALPVAVLAPMYGPPAPWRYLAAIGLSMGFLQFGVLFVGMDIGVPGGLASLVLQTQAFFTALFGLLVFGERPRPRQIAGMAVAFSGIALLGLDLESIAATALGLTLVVAAAAGWAVSNLLMKAARPRNTLHLMCWISLIAPVPLLALSAAVDGPAAMGEAVNGITLKTLGILVYVALFTTLVGFGIWAYLLRVYTAATVAPFSLLVPVFGMSFSALLLDEPFTPLKLAAAVLVISGLALNMGLVPRRIVPRRTVRT